ncbi:hypothetical protein F5146DRAFT_1065415 [Armillaria mellea]|nr:hypothetical protein F5146DRAFT_1065415 [Armillaria mellea]
MLAPTLQMLFAVLFHPHFGLHLYRTEKHYNGAILSVYHGFVLPHVKEFIISRRDMTVDIFDVILEHLLFHLKSASPLQNRPAELADGLFCPPHDTTHTAR